MSVLFKTLPEGEEFEFDEIYKVICSFKGQRCNKGRRLESRRYYLGKSRSKIGQSKVQFNIPKPVSPQKWKFVYQSIYQKSFSIAICTISYFSLVCR